MATPYVEFSSKSPIKSQKREIEKFKLCSTGCHAKLTCGARDNVRACVRACVVCALGFVCVEQRGRRLNESLYTVYAPLRL